MAMDLKSVLETMKKTYSFKVKIAANIDAEKYNNMDVILKAKGMTKRTRPQTLPMNASPIDFPRLKGFLGNIYKMDMDFDYPITETSLKNELCTLLGLDRAFIIVRTSENPLEKYNEDYLEYKDEDYIPQLLTDEMGDDINPDEHYGDKYNEELVKTLQSKEAKKYQQGFNDVDMKPFEKRNKAK